MSEVRYRAGKRLWSAEDDERMRREFPDMRTVELAVSLGRTSTAVSARATILGLKKSAAYLASPAACRLRREATPATIARRYKPGHVPANKGLRRPGWCRGRMRETQFKPGILSGHAKQHLMAIGSTRLVDGYIYVKVAAVPNVAHTVNWKPLHVIEWERANGRMLDTKRECLRFKDGNRLNIAPDNLELIPRRENMTRNSLHNNLPAPLVKTIQLLGALNRKIRRRDHGTQQNQ